MTTPNPPEVPETPRKSFFGFDWQKDMEMLRTVAIAIVVAVTFRSCAFEPFHIPSGSMKSTLLVGDYIWVSKYTYGYSRYSFPFGIKWFEGRIFGNEPERGDVIVFRPPTKPHLDYIKRVIGLPGDRLFVRDGEVTINGFKLKREEVQPFLDLDEGEDATPITRYLEQLPNGVSYHTLDDIDGSPTDNTQIYIVPSDHYFVMGDNRDHSVDSRILYTIGFIPKENIVGQAEAIFFSTDRSAALWEVWNWPQAIRYDRLFTAID
jgi:signal peptidase I